MGSAFVCADLAVVPRSIGPCSTCILGDIDAGWGASSVVYDNTSGTLFVLDNGPSMSPVPWGVTVINGSTDTVARFLHVDGRPGTFSYDPRNGDLYVTGFCTDGVWVLNATTGANVTWIPTSSGLCNAPFAITYDQGTGLLYALLYDPSSLIVINGSTNREVASYSLVTGLSGPNPIAVNPQNGDLYLTTFVNNLAFADQFYVTTVNGWNGSVESSRLLNGSSPTLSYDPLNGHVYVGVYTQSFSGPERYNGTLLTFDATTAQVLASTRVGQLPSGIAADSSNGEIYITNAYSSNVSVVNGTTSAVTGSIPVDEGPSGIVYDDQNRCLYTLFYATVNPNTYASGDGYLSVIAPPGSDCLVPPSPPVYLTFSFWLVFVLVLIAVSMTLVLARRTRR